MSLFAYVDGQFTLEGTLATGLEPAQIVAADLTGIGVDDLIIRNAGDGTLTIYVGNPLYHAFLPPITLAVGGGVSDISVADVNQDGFPDILLANQTSGEVDVIPNLGDGQFGQPTLYRAGVGLSALIAGSGTTPPSIMSLDGTIGVAAVAAAAGGPPDIVALDAGADTLGILTGLGDGRFANPYSMQTTGPAYVVRVADLTGNGIDDLAILGPNGVTIWFGNGQGGFVQGATYNVGPDPTGLTIADVNGDKAARPDRRQCVRRCAGASGRGQRTFPTSNPRRKQRYPRGDLSQRKQHADLHLFGPGQRPAWSSSQARKRSRYPRIVRPACWSQARPCWPT